MGCNCKRPVIQPARIVKPAKPGDTAKGETTVVQNTNHEKNNDSIYKFYGM